MLQNCCSPVFLPCHRQEVLRCSCWLWRRAFCRLRRSDQEEVVGVIGSDVRPSPVCPGLEQVEVSGATLLLSPDCPGRRNTATCPCGASRSPRIVQCACCSHGNGTEASFAGNSGLVIRKVSPACVDEVSFADERDVSGPVRCDACSGMALHRCCQPLRWLKTALRFMPAFW